MSASDANERLGTLAEPGVFKESTPADARRIIDSASDAFVAIDDAGIVIDWNSQAERTFGWARHEALGQRLAELIVPPELRAAHKEGIERFRLTGEGPIVGRRVELRALHRHGHAFPVELAVWATSQPSGWTFNAFVQDVTERHQADEALQRLASIVDASDDAIIGLDLDGAIATWNWAAEQMYGYSPEEALGERVSLLLPSDREDEMANWLELVRSGERVRYQETVRVARGGLPLEVAESISPIRDAGGTVIGASVVDRDTTEYRWMASTLDTTLHKLEDALAEANTARARTRRFLADAAHQLRTPVAGIRVCAETLLQGCERTQQDRLLSDLVRETARVSRLVTSLLRVARLDEGEPVAPLPCDVVKVCADEIDRAWSVAPHLDFKLHAAELAVSQPSLDENLVREVLANLLDNAKRHAAERVEVMVKAAGGGVEIVVADDGAGVPAGMEERIFQRFVSIGDTGGSGLGLAIARELARAHGGELSYGSSGFLLRLPLDWPSQPPDSAP